MQPVSHMKPNPSARVIFYEVTQNNVKLAFICQKAVEAFSQEKKLLITVPNLQAAQYVDDLLWRFSEESFIPHVVTDHPTAEWVAITLQNHINVNGAVRLLNLCPTPPPLFQEVVEIYEFYDKTDGQKAELSQKRYQFYEEKKLDLHRVAAL